MIWIGMAVKQKKDKLNKKDPETEILEEQRQIN